MEPLLQANRAGGGSSSPSKKGYGAASRAGGSDAEGGEEGVHKNKLGTLPGVFVPCCLNIMGIILFMRLGWGVGQAGVLGTLFIILVAELMALVTVSSFSAIVTNGSMAGGGSYYMISRSLGPEFGGAMGILFYLAYAMGVTFYIIGFATEVQATWFMDQSGDDARWTIILIGSIGLAGIFLISYLGAETFAKFNTWFFVIQFFSIGFALFSYTFATEHDLDTQYCVYGFDKVRGECLNGTTASTSVIGFSFETFKENLFPNFQNVNNGAEESVNAMCDGVMCSWTLVFAVLFPMATGIMEGANLSGDLENPSKSIPLGTFMAVGTAIVTYVLIAITIAGSFDRNTLLTNMSIMQEASPTPYVVVVGIIISSISSALGSLFGGSRVLQALSRDKLFPGTAFFAKGSAKGDEPRRAVVLTWGIAQACLFIGDLDKVAPLITAFFCLSYALCNLTAFALSVTGAPNFRPSFRYYSWQLSLLGFVLNIGVMFLLNWSYSLVGVLLLTAIFVFVWWRAPVTNWGDVSQALMYHQVRKYLLRIDEGRFHAKYWRPSVLLFVDDFETTQMHSMVNFCNDMKKGGLLVLGNVLVGNLADFERTQVAARIRTGWLKYIKEERIKAFPQEVISPTLRVGYQFLMQGSGLRGAALQHGRATILRAQPCAEFSRV